MSTDARDQLIEQTVRGAQIIAFAFLVGVLTFSGIAYFLVNVAKVMGDMDPFIPMIMAAISIPGAIAPSIIAGLRQPTSDASDQEICQAYTGNKIVQLVGLEGACFMNLVAYIVGGQWWSYVPVGICVAMMLMWFPSQTELKHQFESLEFQN